MAKGDNAAADEAFENVIRTFTEARISIPESVFAYKILERGDCSPTLIESLDAAPRGFLYEARLVCQAAQLADTNEQGASQLLAALVDGRTGASYWRTDVFDQFARQATLNRKALDWMLANDLDDRRFEIEAEDALIAQVRAGRAGNVAALLSYGYDPNAKRPPNDVSSGASKHELGVAAFPLQAAMQSIAIQGQRALDVTRVLIDNGADPNKLRWAPGQPEMAGASDHMRSEFKRMIEEAASSRDALGTEFVGFVAEYVANVTGHRMYARFMLRNASDETLRVPAWKDGDDYLLGGLYQDAHLQERAWGGTVWSDPVVLEDGASPDSFLELPPGGSHEVLYEWADWKLLLQGSRRDARIRFRDRDGNVHVSEAFRIHDSANEASTRFLNRERRWYPRFDSAETGSLSTGQASAPSLPAIAQANDEP
ncbi:hypothetical protein E1B00_11440 [Arenimonas terrae]|uniref:Ankyrin repeat domain-containing protein n=1 Tax=Arenimonas terrae TaxID=2546226 RepID=A0A5C4RRJ5_9GAMM|nr:hypothetical protein E1B00_11440 [Arenimonas terrae]